MSEPASHFQDCQVKKRKKKKEKENTSPCFLSELNNKNDSVQGFRVANPLLVFPVSYPVTVDLKN